MSKDSLILWRCAEPSIILQKHFLSYKHIQDSCISSSQVSYKRHLGHVGKADQINENFFRFQSPERHKFWHEADLSQPGKGGVLLSTADTDTVLDSQITEILFFP